MTRNRLSVLLASALVLAAVTGGLLVLGSPGAARLQRLDALRINHLGELTAAIDAYARRRQRLPATLEALVDGQLLRVLPVDPLSGARYRFEVVDTFRYRLCADFATATPEASPRPFWSHPAGSSCFEFLAPPSQSQ